MFHQLSIYLCGIFLTSQVYLNNQWYNSIYNNNNNSQITKYPHLINQYSRSYHKLAPDDINNLVTNTHQTYSRLHFNWESNTNHKTDWAEKRLIKDLLYDYEKQSRPVVDDLTPRVHLTATQVAQQITVEFGLELLQILDLDEMDQILTTSVRSLYKWTDHNLIWNPNDYGGIDSVTIPVEHIWIPDISLYNYADERLNERRPCDARIFSDGNVLWNPMGIFKSTCSVDIKYFPFDRQKCVLKFGPWSYDGFRVNISFYDGERNFRLLNYITNPEWNLLNSSAIFTEISYPCCPEKYPDITFHVWIKRKSAFYTYILIIPSILLSSLTSVIFWLPPHSPAKIVLAMNVFVAFLLLHLLLEDTTPAAASNFPLLGAYYCFNMGVITISMFLCCITVNIHFRTSETEQPSKWLRKFISFMGQILFINIDALELIESKCNLGMYLYPHQSVQQSVETASFVNTSNKQFNHSNICEHYNVNNLAQTTSSLPPKSSSSVSTSSSSDEYSYNNRFRNDHLDHDIQCSYCNVQLNTSKSHSLHSKSLKPVSVQNDNNLNDYYSPICSRNNTNCTCYYSKHIFSPTCYLSSSDILIDENIRPYKLSSNTNLFNSHYSLPVDICSNDNMMKNYHLNDNPIDTIDTLNSINDEQYFRNHYIENLTRTTLPFQQKCTENNQKSHNFSTSLYWNKPNKSNKTTKKSSILTTQLKHYFPINLKTIKQIHCKERQSLKHIKYDINYITKAARQLQKELKEREYKEKIIEQWRTVGIVLDRIFFILYFITILLSTLLFHPTLIDDYNDD
ncbi:hypothetical protein MN116_006756 [Schistosoma mekongi]|uniref:Uncharacterized protein n=1 Tax=Schistosoma mekongi TaxID=38744 RepID=A0AAE2D2L9_SCHME|nr:hypothetical protein MN116_006756 [Schistosoma mekongi]